MPIVSPVRLNYRSDSGDFFDRVRHFPDAIWLDSGQPLANQGRFDVISACPDCVIETFGDTSTITGASGSRESRGDPFDLVTKLLEPLLVDQPNGDKVPFTSGIMGYFGYDLGRRYHRIAPSRQSITTLPDMRVGRYLWALLVDHEEKTVQLHFHALCPNALKNKIVEIFLSESPTSSGDDSQRFSCEPFSAQISKSRYIDNLEKISQYIHAGDCYQVNFAQHFYSQYSGDSYHAYRALRRAIPSPYSAYWQWRDVSIMSLSPERFLRVQGDDVETKPIKGTIERGKTRDHDRQNAEALINSEKDRAENLMIVDLLRNDLGKNAQIGSVAVPKLFDLETFPNVHHLVSTITAKIASDKTPIDVLRECFPGGSITGAPKLRAMQIIDQLEAVNRSVYCGSVGYIGTDLSMDTNIAIRTVVADGNRLNCWAGGGIIADSIAEDEYAESIAKIKIILDTLEAC